MKIILILFAIVLGVVISFLLLFFFLYLRFKDSFKNMGYGNIHKLKNMIRQGEYEAKYREKSISGMTKILIPRIEADYKDFNESAFYNKVETSIRDILNSISAYKVSDSKELNLIRPLVEEIIENNKLANIKEEFKDLNFHRHAIKEYKKEGGALTITVASSLEYFYKKAINDKIKEEFSDYKKQTSYTTKFVHIYDPKEYENNKNYLASHCPNCGAILKGFGDVHCDYCGTKVKPINLKTWFISEFKEDKR